MKFFVYVLRSSLDGSIFYVGKSAAKGDRLFDHLNQAKKCHISHKCSKIRKILRQGGQVLQERVFESIDELKTLQFECDLIQVIGLENLTNVVPGGDQAKYMTCWHASMKGTPEYEVWKQRISSSMRHFRHENPVSKETRNKMSAGQKRNLVNGKRVLSEEQRRRMSESMKKHWKQRKLCR